MARTEIATTPRVIQYALASDGVTERNTLLSVKKSVMTPARFYGEQHIIPVTLSFDNFDPNMPQRSFGYVVGNDIGEYSLTDPEQPRRLQPQEGAELPEFQNTIYDRLLLSLEYVQDDPCPAALKAVDSLFAQALDTPDEVISSAHLILPPSNKYSFQVEAEMSTGESPIEVETVYSLLLRDKQGEKLVELDWIGRDDELYEINNPECSKSERKLIRRAEHRLFEYANHQHTIHAL